MIETVKLNNLKISFGSLTNRILDVGGTSQKAVVIITLLASTARSSPVISFLIWFLIVMQQWTPWLFSNSTFWRYSCPKCFCSNMSKMWPSKRIPLRVINFVNTCCHKFLDPKSPLEQFLVPLDSFQSCSFKLKTN